MITINRVKEVKALSDFKHGDLVYHLYSNAAPRVGLILKVPKGEEFKILSLEGSLETWNVLTPKQTTAIGLNAAVEIDVDYRSGGHPTAPRLELEGDRWLLGISRKYHGRDEPSEIIDFEAAKLLAHDEHERSGKVREAFGKWQIFLRWPDGTKELINTVGGDEPKKTTTPATV
jgi:hypothetical protein